MSEGAAGFRYFTAAELVDEYRGGRLSPVAAVDAYLGRIAQLDPELGSFITVTRDRALQQAEASRQRYAGSRPLSPLDGVPFAPKDIFATEGIRTTHGSKLGADHVPTETATAVKRLEAAGAVMLGKLNLFEFATGSGTESGFGPATRGASTRTPGALRAAAGPRSPRG